MKHSLFCVGMRRDTEAVIPELMKTQREGGGREKGITGRATDRLHMHTEIFAK